MKYIELHTCSAFSFLQGSSTPEQLAQEAARLQYPALALVDRDGVHVESCAAVMGECRAAERRSENCDRGNRLVKVA